jgi:hypothetical protein
VLRSKWEGPNDSIGTKHGKPDGRRGWYGQANHPSLSIFEAYKIIPIIEHQGDKPTAS